MVALGCYQHLGVDYEHSNSPVLMDVSIRLLLMIYLLNETFEISQVDIEAEFLEGKI